MTHPIESLFRDLSIVEPNPDGVVPMSGRLPATAFFPGGSGLWRTKAGWPLPAVPTAGVMILGHDFHSQAAFTEALKHGGEVDFDPAGTPRPRVPTWATTLPLLDEFCIPPQRCFFTNVYMGLRAGSKTTGRFAGARDAAFVARCRRFFQRQLEMQQPRVILTLGAWVPRFLAPLSQQLDDWRLANTLKQLDRLDAVRHRVVFTRVDTAAFNRLSHASKPSRSERAPPKLPSHEWDRSGGSHGRRGAIPIRH